MATTATKVLDNLISSALMDEYFLGDFMNDLLDGNLLGFEKKLTVTVRNLYDGFVSEIFRTVFSSIEFENRLKEISKSLGLSKLSKRTFKLQVSTGTWISFESLYAEKAPPIYNSERSLFHLHFKTVAKASPLYVSRAAQLSVMTPSFSIAEQVMSGFECDGDAERNRQLSLMAGHSALENRIENMLLPEETLSDKRVIIGIDGGGTRTREWKEESDNRYGEFSTPWKEPKLLVISTIDEHGKVDKKRLPVYDVSFGDDETFELLKGYLKALQIEKAQSVQIVADGAPWIWNRAKPMLIGLGVPENIIFETLDYYHAVEHLNELKQYLPKSEQESTMKTLKELLGKGDIPQMKQVLSQLLPDFQESPLKPFDYFEKNKGRMQYDVCKIMNMPVGSGIVESCVRRIINLRFKCPSSFWNIENLQPLFYLRAAFLSGRWNNLFRNLT